MSKDCKECVEIWNEGLLLNKDVTNISINDFSRIKDLISSNPILEYNFFDDNKYLGDIITKIKNVIQKLGLVELFIFDLYLPSDEQNFTSIYLALNKDELNINNEKLKKLYISEYKLNNKIFDSNKVLYYLSTLKKKISNPIPVMYLINEKEGLSENFDDVLLIKIGKLSKENDSFNSPEQSNTDEFVDRINELYSSFNLTSINYSTYFNDKLINILTEYDKITIYGTEFENVKSAFLTYLSFFKAMVPLSHNSKEIVEFIYFPAISSYHIRDKKNQLTIYNNWIGGVLLAFKEHSTQRFRHSLSQFIQYVVSLTYQNYQLLRLDLEKQLAIFAATRAAIAQVFARNMSHNIGSHVLSKLLKDTQLMKIFFENKNEDNRVGNVSDIKSILTNNKVFYQCLNALRDIDVDSSNNTYSEDKTKETNESLLAYFFDYLKSRMDYLADITTSTPIMENTKGLYNDIVKTFIRNRVLNDRISGLDKFFYEITVCMPVITKNGDINCEEIITKNDCSCLLNDNNDIHLSVPNDVLGIQAFYTILENVIRNTAKHGTTPFKLVKKDDNYTEEKVPFEFKIKVEEASQRFADLQISNPKTDLHLDEYYCISIFDNCALQSETKVDPDEYTGEEANKIEKYREKKISEGEENGKILITIKRIHKLVVDLNFILNKSILEDNKSLRHGGWGLIEMDASAAYLRKFDIELIDSDNFSIADLHGENPITEGNQLSIYQAYVEQKKYLGYRFFVRKPQEILIIGAVKQLLAKTEEASAENDITVKLKELKYKGIWIKSKDEIIKAIKDNTVFPHRLIVIDSAYTDLLSSILNNPHFSNRILKDLCVTKISSLLNYDTINKMSENVSQLWKYFYNNQSFKTYHDTNKSWATDDHGKTYCKFVNVEKKDYVEIFNTATKHFFNVTLEKELNKKYSWPLKIVVIDERIQYFAKNAKYALERPDNNGVCEAKSKDKVCWHDNGVPYSKLYEKTNILVPDIEMDCNLNEQNFYSKTSGNDQYDKILKYIHDHFVAEKLEQTTDSTRIEKTEFLVIHLGVVEKLITAWNKKGEATNFDKEKKDDVRKFIRGKLLTPSNCASTNEEKMNSLYDWVIITSGRGKPHNLPNDIRYLNFSVISQYMITQRCKYAFTEALYSARKTF